MKRPKQVILEVTNRCNLKCKFCPNTCNDSFPVGDMTLDMFKGIVDQMAMDFPDAVAIPWMNGEPFMNPDFLEMVRYLSLKKVRFYVTTNLTIWRKDVVEFLLSDKSTCYQLIVSMDGLEGTGSIGTARPGTDEGMLLKNVNQLLIMKGQMNSEKDVAFKICERGQDWQEIEDYIQYWLGDERVNYVCVGKPLKDENETSMRRHPCQYFDNNFMVIRWDGTLVPCAYNDRVANKLMLSYGRFQPELLDRLLVLYNNQEVSRLRIDQNKGIFHEPCASCAFAYTGHGFGGEVRFRKDELGKPVYFHQDYYNSFFSLRESVKKAEYYLGGR